MCNSIHTCQTAIFDWLKHSICMNIKCRKESQPFFLSDFCLLDSSAVQYGQVESPNPVKYTFFIHPSAHPSPLSIDPVWSRVTGVSPELRMREKKGQFSMYCISRKNHTSRFPLGGVTIGTSETLHRLTFFELADEKCSSCFVCRSLKMYGWSEAFAAEAALLTGNATKAVWFLRVQNVCGYAEHLTESKNTW